MRMNGKRSGIHWWGRLWNSPLPKLGCEISDTGISIARWSRNSAELDTAAWSAIPAGAVEASPLRENIHQPEEVRKAFAEALDSLGMAPAPDSSRRGTDAVLVLPDQAARLFVLDFDTFPQRKSEGLPLVKWRLKKSVPFDIESAAISHWLQRSGAELQVVAVATPQWIIRQYEAIAEHFGLRPRCVTLSTLAALGLATSTQESLLFAGRAGEPASNTMGGNGRPNLKPGGPAAVLVAKFSPPWFTTAILQGAMLRLFRTVGLSAGEDGLISPDEALAAIYPSVAYFQDNFAGLLARGYLCGLGENSSAIAALLESELNLQAGSLMEDIQDLAVNRHGAEEHFAALLGIARENGSQ